MHLFAIEYVLFSWAPNTHTTLFSPALFYFLLTLGKLALDDFYVLRSCNLYLRVAFKRHINFTRRNKIYVHLLYTGAYTHNIQPCNRAIFCNSLQTHKFFVRFIFRSLKKTSWLLCMSLKATQMCFSEFEICEWVHFRTQCSSACEQSKMKKKNERTKCRTSSEFSLEKLHTVTDRFGNVHSPKIRWTIEPKHFCRLQSVLGGRRGDAQIWATHLTANQKCSRRAPSMSLSLRFVGIQTSWFCTHIFPSLAVEWVVALWCATRFRIEATDCSIDLYI